LRWLFSAHLKQLPFGNITIAYGDMMKIFIIGIILGIAMALEGCARINLPSPTITPSNTSLKTFTKAPTIHAPPTITFTRMPSRIPTMENTCGIDSGAWVSNEESGGFISSPIVSFTITNCNVTQVDIMAYPAPSELFMDEYTGQIEITDKTFSYSAFSGKGKYTLEGEWNSELSCKGTLKFTKGFFIVDYTLNKDVTILWTASPGVAQ
jgi:hypothetical protein